MKKENNEGMKKKKKLFKINKLYISLCIPKLYSKKKKLIFNMTI
jgi:hypothetical protein